MTEQTVYELNGTQRDLLAAAAPLKNPNGRDIRTKYRVYTGEDPAPGKLYRNLNRLADKGYLEIKEKTKRSNSYQITPKGREGLRELVKTRADALELDISVSELEVNL